MPEETAARVTGRGEELDRALSEAKTWAEVKRRPSASAPPEELAAWNAEYAPYRLAISKAFEAAPASALCMAVAADWRKAFDEAKGAPDMKTAALALARRGFLIFPCHSQHKGPHPILGDVGGHRWATDNPTDIEAWWHDAPDACIGFIMGRRTGVFAIDIDVGEAHGNIDGRMSFTRFTSDLGLTSLSGRSHETANGGIHLLFKWYDGGPRGKRKLDAYEGVEIIGDDAFIVIPPSRLRDGKQYKVRDNTLPPLPPKKLMAALDGGKGKEKVKKIREQPEPAPDAKWDPAWCKARLDEAVAALQATVKGTYDATAEVALKIGSIVAGGGLDDAAAWAALSEAASAADKPRDYLAKVQRAYQKGKENPWTPHKQFIKWFDWYGKPQPTLANAVQALEYLNIAPYLNELSHRIMVLSSSGECELTEETELNLRMEIRHRMDMGFDPGEKNMRQALVYLGFKTKVHPYRDYLNGLRWDGGKRLQQLMPRYFGTKDTRYARLVGYCFIMGIVARAYRPGCKQDYTVVLEGGQGEYKSQACRILMSDEYFAGNMPDIHRTAALEQVQGKLLIELAEIVTLIRTDLETLKAFLTNDKDTFRVPYDKYPLGFPRTVTFIGTTNEYNWLNDITGGRRFWPMRVGLIDLKPLARDRDQIFAEAVAKFKREPRGSKWWPSRWLEARLFAPEQEARQEIDERETDIYNWVMEEANRRAKGNGGMSARELWDNKNLGVRGFTAKEIWSGAWKMSDTVVFGTGHQRQVIKCLKRLGCDQHSGDTSRRYWLPPLGWKTGGVGERGDNDDIPF